MVVHPAFSMAENKMGLIGVPAVDDVMDAVIERCVEWMFEHPPRDVQQSMDNEAAQQAAAAAAGSLEGPPAPPCTPCRAPRAAPAAGMRVPRLSRRGSPKALELHQPLLHAGGGVPRHCIRALDPWEVSCRPRPVLVGCAAFGHSRCFHVWGTIGGVMLLAARCVLELSARRTVPAGAGPSTSTAGEQPGSSRAKRARAAPTRYDRCLQPPEEWEEWPGTATNGVGPLPVPGRGPRVP